MRLIGQFIKFGFVGAICFVVDYGLMVFLTEMINMPYLVSCAISFSIAVVVNYYLSMKYVFASRDDLNRRQEFIIFVILSLAGLALTEFLMWVLVSKFGIYYMFSKIIVTGIVMIFNFATRKLLLDAKP